VFINALPAQDDLSAEISNGYPFISATETFRLLLMDALEIQTQLSNRLRLFLSESELASDDFNVYKTWEGKAANYNACVPFAHILQTLTSVTACNITATGNRYWHCV
jgi:hypothetical protein